MDGLLRRREMAWERDEGWKCVQLRRVMQHNRSSGRERQPSDKARVLLMPGVK
jgi:hypothetical protein